MILVPLHIFGVLLINLVGVLDLRDININQFTYFLESGLYHEFG
jgi:hypothetical protein